MSENDFNNIDQDQYRGSVYSNFTGGGIDAQGNVSSALIENTANNVTSPAQSFTQSPAVADSLSGMQSEMSSVVPYNAESMSSGGSAMGSLASKALPSVGGAIGSEVAKNIAFGATGENIFSNVGSSIASKLSGGLLSPAAGSSAHLASLSSQLSGAPGTAAQAASSGFGKAAGSGFGGAAGTGIGAAAATLLSGGSIGEAAKSGVLSSAGYYVGYALGGPVGAFIGSALSSLVGGFFGGGLQRQTSGAKFKPDASGRYTVGPTSGKNVDSSSQRKYADRVATVLNGVADQFGIKFTKNVNIGANVGEKDPGTYLGGKMISSKPYDMDKVSLSLLQDQSMYTFGDNGDSVIQGRLPEIAKKSSSLKDLGIKLDEFNLSRGLIGGNLPNLKQQNRYSFGV